MPNIKLTPFERSSQASLWGPSEYEYTEPDWEARELSDRALQGLSRTLQEEES